MRHPADAEDAAQISLLEILRAAPSFAGVGRLEAWADRITARTATRQVVRERKRAAVVLPPPDSSSDTGLAEGLARPLSAYLDELPAAQRQVLVLRHALGYSNAEIAELTESPPGTVKDRLVRARKQIRKVIAREQAIGRRKAVQS